MERQKSGSFRNKRPALADRADSRRLRFSETEPIAAPRDPRPLGTRSCQGDKIAPSEARKDCSLIHSVTARELHSTRYSVRFRAA